MDAGSFNVELDRRCSDAPSALGSCPDMIEQRGSLLLEGLFGHRMWSFEKDRRGTDRAYEDHGSETMICRHVETRVPRL